MTKIICTILLAATTIATISTISTTNALPLHTAILAPYTNLTTTTNYDNCIAISFTSTSNITYKLLLFDTIIQSTTGTIYSAEFQDLEDEPYESVFINKNNQETTVSFTLDDCSVLIKLKIIIVLVCLVILLCVCAIQFTRPIRIPCIHPRLNSNSRLEYYNLVNNPVNQSQPNHQ